MDRLFYQDLQERCAEEASTSGVDRFGSDIESLSTNKQLVKERRKLQEVERLLKSVDKVLECFLFAAFTAVSSYCRDDAMILINSGWLTLLVIKLCNVRHSFVKCDMPFHKSMLLLSIEMLR